jgi:hypothetical protein
MVIQDSCHCRHFPLLSLSGSSVPRIACVPYRLGSARWPNRLNPLAAEIQAITEM